MRADLHKKEDLSFTQKWEQYMELYAPYLLIISLIILVLLVSVLICTLMGVSAHSLTGTEANNYYYHLEDLV